jgi:alanyl-tRNA synthetase
MTCGQIVKKVCTELGGNGGGSQTIGQGSVPADKIDEALKLAKLVIAEVTK